MASKLSLLFAELKRRKVYHVGVAYVVVGSSVIVGAQFLLVELLGLHNLAAQVVGVLIVLGFPIALVLAWAYEVRPEEPREAEKAPAGAIGSRKAEQGKSIVVLPFDNMSPDPGDTYFCDGLTEEIITHLSHIQSLRVISRSSAMVLKGTQKDIRTIGKDLDVQYVLEGSVRKAGDDLRITAQLIDAGTDAHLWAEKYDGALGDVFSIQERVARSIVEELALGLSATEERFIQRRAIPNLPAYECYLKARQHVWEGTSEALDRADKYLQTALGIVENNALIHAALGYVYFQKANFGYERDEAVEKAQEYSRRALELDTECTLAEVVLGACHQAFLGDQKAAIYHLKRAMYLDQNNTDVVIWLVNAFLIVGRMEDARALARHGVSIDPLSPMSHLIEGFTYLHDGDFESAISSTARAYEMAPDSPQVILLHSQALAYGGRIAELEKLSEEGFSTDSIVARGTLAMAAAAKGDVNGVLEQMSEEVEQTARRDCQMSWFLAAPLARVGETEQALKWLNNALDQGFINYPALAVDPFLSTLKGEPRFEAFMAKVKTRWEIFEV